jgi:hypothetical protein
MVTGAPGKSRTGAMQLGAAKVPTSKLAAELAAEASSAATSGWGDGDLMDVNADESDWSMFASAPAEAQTGMPGGVGLGFDDFDEPKAGKLYSVLEREAIVLIKRGSRRRVGDTIR